MRLFEHPDFEQAMLRAAAHHGLPITSLVAQYLAEQGPGDFAEAEDLAGFDMSLLHYRRTFVEKMFALHGKMVRFQEEGHPLGRDARHYPDLYVLAGEHEVRSMLASPEYEEIRRDYDRKSREFFAKSYRPPTDLSFADSPALFPDANLRDQLAHEFEAQCRLLFSSDDCPAFDEVLERFEEIRELL